MATNNDFVVLAVPASTGVGAPSDISDMAFGPSIIVDGPDSSSGKVIIEVSEDGTNFAPATTVFPIHNPTARILDVVARFARVRRFSGTGPANVALGSVKTTHNSFAALTSTSVPADTSEMGPLRTVVVVGQYDTPISIMGSNDGTNYDVIVSFNSLGSDVISFVGSYAFTRLRCDSSLNNVAVAIGGGFVAALSSAGGVTSVNTLTGAVVIVGDNGISISELGGQIHVGQELIANWDPTVMRIYAIDGEDGDDGNVGFATPASPSQADYEIACDAAGLVAKKTFAGLAAIFPKNGNGRMAEIVTANGGVNTEGVYAEDIAIFLGSCFGYAGAFPLVRGTGTNPNAGCTKFDGTLKDVIYQGGITVPGLNVAGYNAVTGSTPSFITCTKVGGGSPAFPPEPAAPLGWRIRFSATTATLSLRGLARDIGQVFDAENIFLQTDLPDSPTSADLFFIEQAGVLWTLQSLIGGTGLGNPVTSFQAQSQQNRNAAQISGLRCSDNIIISESCLRFIFSGTQSLNMAGYGVLVTSQDLFHPVYGLVTIGGGLRVENSFNTNAGPGEVYGKGLVLGVPGNVGSLEFAGLSRMSFGPSCFASQLSITDHYGVSQNEPRGNFGSYADLGGGNAGQGPNARLNLLTIDGSRVMMDTMSIENSTIGFPRPCIQLSGECQLYFAGNVSGSVGNDDVALDLSQSVNSLIIMATMPTVTGLLGDIRLSTGEIVSWADVFNNGFVDANGNRFIGSLRASGGGSPLGYMAFTGSISGAVGAAQSYLADGGLVGAVNQTTPFNRPTSLRFITRLRVSVVGNTSANAVTATLIKNGVPTAMQVTIPAGSVASQSNLTSRVLFLDSDTFDLRLDDPVGDAGGVVSVSASLEWPL